MTVWYIAALTVLASGLGSLTGFGTAAVLVPVLILWFPLASTLLIVSIIQWFTDVWRLVLFRKGFDWELIVSFGASGILMTWFGAMLVFFAPPAVLSQVVGAFLLTYAIFLLSEPSFQFERNPVTSTFGGAVAGFIAGISGVGGAVRGAFLSAYGLSQVTYFATGAAIAFAVDSVRLIAYWREGARFNEVPMWSLGVFVIASFIGSQIGKQFITRVPVTVFRIIIALVLFVVGIQLIFIPSAMPSHF